MKKFYAFLAAALMSVSVFASKDVVPSDEVLADYYDAGKVCVCIFIPADMACYDAVLTGKFNGWSSEAAECEKFVAVEGFDGWYVASCEPVIDEEYPEKGVQAKPVMLDGDGKFNWAYQAGAATVIRGGVQVIEGLPGEIDLVNYGTDAPNVYTVDAWKENPCTAVYHNYTVEVISDGCGFLAVPFIIGGMNNWKEQEMQINEAKTTELEVPVYNLTFKAAEGTEYQLLSGLRDPETGLIDSTAKPGWYDDAYLQVLVNNVWERYNPSNSKLGEEAFVSYDLRVDTLRWARCAPAEDPEVVAFAIKLPAENIPEAVEVIGGFDSWAGTALTWNPSTDFFEATFEAKASQFFKIRGAGEWKWELELYNEAEDKWAKISDGQLVFGQLWEDAAEGKSLTLDFGDPEKARWHDNDSQGIENITLTEKAQKVVVDGVLYIVRDNKMFNVQGTQVR